MKSRSSINSIKTLLALVSIGTASAIAAPTVVAQTATPPSSSAPAIQSETTPAPSGMPSATELLSSPTEAPTQPTTESSSGTVVDVAASSESFTTLTSAIQAAGLTETLQGAGPFTVFAPTDAAFAALPPGTVEELMKPENRDVLVQVLTYHVVPDEVMSTELSSGEVTTVEGSAVTVEVGNGAVMVNDATVTQPDIPASNGVIHVIDRVILPPDM